MERLYLSKISLLLILLVAVVAFLFGAYVSPFVAMNFAQTGLGKSGSLAGRFTLVISPLVKTEKFLLDSQTGKIWQLKADNQSDNSLVCRRLAVIGEVDRAHTTSEQSKSDYALSDKGKSNLRVAKGKSFGNQASKISQVKTLTETIIPSDKVTIEVISNGKISKERVPRANTLNNKVIDEKALSKNKLSVKTTRETNL